MGREKGCMDCRYELTAQDRCFTVGQGVCDHNNAPLTIAGVPAGYG